MCSFCLEQSSDMGCPLCKDRPVSSSTGCLSFDAFVRKPSLRASRPMASPTIGLQQESDLRNCKLEFQQQHRNSEEPPIYFLSGNPALRAATPLPSPKKAPRTSGWKEATLKAAVAAEEYEQPSRPPRRHQQHNPQEQILLHSSSNALQPPESSRSDSLKHSSSTSSLHPVLPEETAEHLKEYLRKNPSITSLRMLMDVIQTNAGMEDGSSDDEQWNEDCLDMHVRAVSPIPMAPNRKRRSVETPPSYPPPPPPPPGGEETDVSSEHESLVLRGHWEDESDFNCIVQPHMRKQLKIHPSSIKGISLSPNRLTPNHSREDCASSPCTPGPWFDCGLEGFPETTPSPSLSQQHNKRFSPISKQQTTVVTCHSPYPNDLHDEMTQQPPPTQITPPPSLNNDEDDDVAMPREITHSILLKVLQQCSDDFGNNKLLSRRASVIPSNIPVEGLHEFIKTLQSNQEQEKKDQDTHSVSPSIGELENALADLLANEKLNEKEIKNNTKELQSSET